MGYFMNMAAGDLSGNRVSVLAGLRGKAGLGSAAGDSQLPGSEEVPTFRRRVVAWRSAAALAAEGSRGKTALRF